MTPKVLGCMVAMENDYGPGFHETWLPMACAYLECPASQTRAALRSFFGPVLEKVLRNGRTWTRNGNERKTQGIFFHSVDVFLESAFVDLWSPETANFSVGAPGSIALAHLTSSLTKLLNRDAPITIEEIARRQVAALDASSLAPCRGELIRASGLFLSGELTASIIGRAALLCFFAPPDSRGTKASYRALPYRSSERCGDFFRSQFV